jgi:hypothetical protein
MAIIGVIFRPRNVASQDGSIWKFIGWVYSDLAMWRYRATLSIG